LDAIKERSYSTPDEFKNISETYLEILNIKNLEIHDINSSSAQHTGEEEINTMKNLVCSEELYENYVQSLENEEKWLGCKSAKLFAYSNNIKFYIWEDSGNSQLQLLEKQEDGTSTFAIHALNNNCVPFSILLEK